MKTKDEVYQVLFDWLKDETGMTVIKANQKGPRPDRPYVSINFTNPSTQLGQPQHAMYDIDDSDPLTWLVTTEGMKKAVAVINIFGENAVDTLSEVRDSISRPDVQERFERGEIAVEGDPQPNDLTGLLETAYEERGQMDLVVMFVAGSEVDVGTIEEISITGSVGDQEIKVSTT